MMMFLPQHDAHCVDHKSQDAAAYGREMCDKSCRELEAKFAPMRANIEAMRRIAPEAFRKSAAERRKPHLFVV